MLLKLLPALLTLLLANNDSKPHRPIIFSGFWNLLRELVDPIMFAVLSIIAIDILGFAGGANVFLRNFCRL